MAREYVVGVPLAIIVRDDGTVVFEFDLADVDRDAEPCADEAVRNLQFSQDMMLLSEVTGRLGNAFSTTIYPARNNA